MLPRPRASLVTITDQHWLFAIRVEKWSQSGLSINTSWPYSHIIIAKIYIWLTTTWIFLPPCHFLSTSFVSKHPSLSNPVFATHHRTSWWKRLKIFSTNVFGLTHHCTDKAELTQALRKMWLRGPLLTLRIKQQWITWCFWGKSAQPQLGCLLHQNLHHPIHWL